MVPEAAEAVDEPELQELILSFGQALARTAVADDTAPSRQDAAPANDQRTSPKQREEDC